jgi:hypothetical protein
MRLATITSGLPEKSEGAFDWIEDKRKTVGSCGIARPRVAVRAQHRASQSAAFICCSEGRP